jgi:hypothetical protein
MNAEVFRDLLKRHPFESFRIRLSSGDAYDVRNPDLVVIMKSRLFIAFPGEDRYVLCSFLHIAAVDNLQAA